MWRPARAVLPVVFLVACGSHVYHLVREGETLYSVSWRYGKNYLDVAQWNQIPPPYTIHPGERIRIVPPRNTRTHRLEGQPAAELGRDPRPVELVTPAPGVVTVEQPTPVPADTGRIDWIWPLDGPLSKRFSVQQPGKKGIDILGHVGDRVRAAAAGKVVYAGSGLASYGNLLIIKHNETYLSAYAHNRVLLVEEGDWVQQGQTVGEVGFVHPLDPSPTLHFEIRLNGSPVDPLRYLPRHPAGTAE